MHVVAAIFILLLIAPSSQPLLAQLDGPYVVSPGENPEHTAPTSSAKLCFVTTIRPCYTLPADGPQDSGEEPLFFGLAPKAEHIPFPNGHSAVLFYAYTYGGSGCREYLALLTLTSKGEIKNLLPAINITNQSDNRFFAIPHRPDAMPAFVTADAEWLGPEGHYGAHHYTIRIYRFDAARQQYFQALRYTTVRRYPGIDSSEAAYPLLQHEHSYILRRLQQHRASK